MTTHKIEFPALPSCIEAEPFGSLEATQSIKLIKILQDYALETWQMNAPKATEQTTYLNLYADGCFFQHRTAEAARRWASKGRSGEQLLAVAVPIALAQLTGSGSPASLFGMVSLATIGSISPS